MTVATVVMKLVPVAGVKGDVVAVETDVVLIGVELMALVLTGVVVVAGRAAVATVGVTAAVLTAAGVVVAGVAATLETLTAGLVVTTLPVPVPAVPASEGRGTKVPPMTIHVVPSRDRTKPGGQIPSDTTRFTWTPVCAKAEADAKPSAAMADAAAARAVTRERVERMMVSSIDASSSDSPHCTEFYPVATKRDLGGNPRSTRRSTRGSAPHSSFGTLHPPCPTVGLSYGRTMVGNSHSSNAQ